jgi:hypothetical protein
VSLGFAQSRSSPLDFGLCGRDLFGTISGERALILLTRGLLAGACRPPFALRPIELFAGEDAPLIKALGAVVSRLRVFGHGSGFFKNGSRVLLLFETGSGSKHRQLGFGLGQKRTLGLHARELFVVLQFCEHLAPADALAFFDEDGSDATRDLEAQLDLL